MGGMVLCIGDFVMACAIDLLGLTIACPIGFSISLIFGSTVTYVIEPKADPLLLFPGIVCNLCGMLFDTASHAKMVEREPKSTLDEPSACGIAAGPQDDKPVEPVIGDSPDRKCSIDAHRKWKLLLVPLLGGSCCAASGPIVTVAGALGHLDPYVIACLFMVGQLLALLPVLTAYVMLVKPGSLIVSRCIPAAILTHFANSLQKAPRSSFWNAMAGLCTGSGWWLFLVGTPVVSRAVGFTFGCSAPLTCIFYGVVIFGEFRGQPRQAQVYSCFATCFFVAAMAFMTVASL